MTNEDKYIKACLIAIVLYTLLKKLDCSLRVCDGAASSQEVCVRSTSPRNQMAEYQCWLHLDSRSRLRPTSLFFRPISTRGTIIYLQNAKDGSKMFSTLSRLAAKESVVQIPWIGRMTNTVQLLLRGKILKTAIVLQVAYALTLCQLPVLG